MISTHILDTNLGKPAANVEIKLFSASGELLATAFTNQDGRVLAPDFALESIEVADYSIEFSIKPYFDAQQVDTFFPKAVIHFSITNVDQHYHIPLLISPFAYSTYRGS
jgi:5-hydroxyisourate hydrolase